MANYSKKKFKNKNKIKKEEKNLELADSRWYTSPFFVLGIIFVVIAIATSRLLAFDNDQYFLVATGRDIIKNGISHINNMTWLKGLEIVVQQWLYAIVFAFIYDHTGRFSGIIICAISMALAFLALYKVARLRNNQEKSFFIAGLFVLCSAYILGPRPTLLTEALLLWQIYICESGKNKWWIPLLVLLESNLHSSYIIFHFVYLLPYIVPGITKWLEDNHDFKYIKIIPAMIIAAFCNPYGIKGTLYLFYSYYIVENNIIAELQPFNFSRLDIIIAFIICILITIMLVTKFREGIPSAAFYIYIGTMTMLIIFPVNKNVFFMSIGLLPVTSFLFKDIKRVKNYRIEVVLAIILMVVVIVTTLPKKINLIDESYIPKTINYLKKAKPKRMFTPFNVGAVVEFSGMKCFIDSRPELFLKKINGKYDYYLDEDKMCSGTDNDRDKLQKKYNFDYYLIEDENTELIRWAEENCEYIMNEKTIYLYKYK